jgi:hypothetical protein
MAKQKGIIKLEGTIGDITFLKSKDGYLAKGKSSVTANRIATDPAFARTRENNAEFGRAGKAGKVLRNAFRAVLQKASDGRMVSRLTQEMFRVLQADLTSTRGQRNVIDGEAELLEGFDFNINGKLGTTLFAPYTPMINRVTGDAGVSIPAFVPAQMVAAPSGTTHFRLFSAAAEVDFQQEVYTAVIQESGMLPWDGNATGVINLQQALPANSTHPLFLALGIEFLQQVNNTNYPLKNGSFNALAIVQVSGV